MSADTKLQQIVLGYYWGIFLPLGNNHRFLKIGFGPGIVNSNFNVKLNLCEEFKITARSNSDFYKDGECVGKKEIDTASTSKNTIVVVNSLTLWERVTDDSVWRVFTFDSIPFWSSFVDLNFKKHPFLYAKLNSSRIEYFSYTYRF